MKNQIIVIHGGGSFATYQEYLSSLLNYRLELKDLLKVSWKERIRERLGEEFEIITPQMPNKRNAKYQEWKIWFEKLFPFLRDNTILVGHSLGGVFLAKYLSEEMFPKKIKAVFLVAPPYDGDEGRALVEFTLPKSLEGLEKQSGKIFIYHSKDDPVVAFSETEKYKQALPNAVIITFNDRGHFSNEDFPEIIRDIKAIDA